MLHGIRWRESGEFDLLPADRRRRVERVRIKAGEEVVGVVRCHVSADLVEQADITVDEGILKDVPCAFFQFLDMEGEGEEGV